MQRQIDFKNRLNMIMPNYRSSPSALWRWIVTAIRPAAADGLKHQVPEAFGQGLVLGGVLELFQKTNYTFYTPANHPETETRNH